MISPKQMIPRKLLLLITLFMGLMVTCEGPGEDPVLQCPNTTIEGEDGDTVILPCSTKDKMDISLEEVEWLFEDPPGEYKTVHAYFQHKDYLYDQRDDFINRTSLFKEELSSGNCSLSLKGTTSHSGRYHCYVPGYQSCNVTLKVLEAGKNNPSQNHQEVNPNNGTDGQTNYGAIGGVVGGVVLGGIAAVLGIIALVVHLRRKRRKRLCSGRKPKTSQTYQEVSDQAQQQPLKIKNPWTQMN